MESTNIEKMLNELALFCFHTSMPPRRRYHKLVWDESLEHPGAYSCSSRCGHLGGSGFGVSRYAPDQMEPCGICFKKKGAGLEKADPDDDDFDQDYDFYYERE